MVDAAACESRFIEMATMNRLANNKRPMAKTRPTDRFSPLPMAGWYSIAQWTDSCTRSVPDE